MDFPRIPESLRLQRLAPPTGKIRMVLDTDTYNEIDDQFALTYAVLSPDRLQLDAIYAAPFHNKRSTGPADGMEKSYEEILRLLERLNVSPDGLVYRGSTQYLADWNHPVESPASTDLIERALAMPDGEPLYVAAIGAITNVASAILLEPSIIERIVLVWLGGNPAYWPTASEFNLMQDIPSSRLVFDCGVPMMHIPCQTVTTHLHSTVPEIERYVEGQGAIGDFLAQRFKEYSDNHFGWSKVIWDLAAIAYLLDASWTPSNLVHSPILTDQVTWSHDNSRHFIRSAYFIERDPIFRDLFTKLAKYAK